VRNIVLTNLDRAKTEASDQKKDELAKAEAERNIAAVKEAEENQARAIIFGASTLGSRVYLFSFSSPFPWRESLPP
jgi:hypothetical protein